MNIIWEEVIFLSLWLCCLIFDIAIMLGRVLFSLFVIVLWSVDSILLHALVWEKVSVCSDVKL